MQKEILDDFAKMMAGVLSGTGAMREQLDHEIRQKIQQYFAKELVGREEFEVFRELLQKVIENQQTILERLDRLEANMPATANIKSTGANNKAVTNKAVTNKSMNKKTASVKKTSIEKTSVKKL